MADPGAGDGEPRVRWTVEQDRDELVGPLDADDPRFAGSGDGRRRTAARELVASRGPGSSRMDPNVRRIRVAIPVVFFLVLAAVATVFFVGLDPGDGQQTIGPVAAVRAAVGDRPHRVCYEGSLPCAWIALLDGELVAFNTSGPLNAEFGRLGVSWCPSSGRFGSNVTGSRFDTHGNVVDGPAPRGLDRYALATTPEGQVRIDFFVLATGQQVATADPPVPPDGPECDEIPFDRDADLVLSVGG